MQSTVFACLEGVVDIKNYAFFRFLIMSAQRKNILHAIAASQSRKELDKELARARKEFGKAKTEFDAASAQLDALQAKVNHAQQQMSNARQNIVNLTNHIQMMDLTGANAVRDRGDVRTYIMDGKEYHAEKTDNNDVRLTPWKEYKQSKKEEKDDDNSVADNFISALNMISGE